MAVTFSVVNAPYLAADLLLDFAQAAGEWAHYLQGEVTLRVELDVGPFANRAGYVIQNDPTTFTPTGETYGGHTVVATWAQYALMTGAHVPGTDYDIHFTLDPNAAVYFNPNPASGGAVPETRYDAVTLFRKTLAYALGLATFSTTNASDGSIQTVLDRHVGPGMYSADPSAFPQDVAGGMSLIGPNVIAVNGGPVPLTVPRPTWAEAYVHVGNTPTVSGLTDLMIDTPFLLGKSVPISRLDLAIMQDAGLALMNVPCFAAGTRLLTPGGPVPVEALRAGDMLVLARGGLAPVRWIGRRRLDCRRHGWPREVWPVRVRAGAFGPGRPARDLRLSPDHSVFAGGAPGVLIPVRLLVNESTIVQERVAAITYFHVELPAHDVVLAEGLAVESYLDTGNRGAFANGGPAVGADPVLARTIWRQRGCVPLVLAGPRLAAARRGLLARAEGLGHVTTAEPDLRLVLGRRSLMPVPAGHGLRFLLPPGRHVARLRSRAHVPAELRADSVDTRRLGVAVAELLLDRHPVALSDRRLGGGWHLPEPAWRWTDGDAELRLEGAREVLLRLGPTGRYLAGRA